MKDLKNWVLTLTWSQMSSVNFVRFPNLIASISPLCKMRKWVGGLLGLMISGPLSPTLHVWGFTVSTSILFFFCLFVFVFYKMPFKPWEVLVFFVIRVAQFWAINPNLNPGLRSYRGNCVKIKARSLGETPAERQRPGVFLIDLHLPGAALQTPLDAHACVPAFYTTELCLVSSPLPECLMMVTLIWAPSPKSKWSFV